MRDAAGRLITPDFERRIVPIREPWRALFLDVLLDAVTGVAPSFDESAEPAPTPRPATPPDPEPPNPPPEPRLVAVSRAEEDWTRDRQEEIPDNGGHWHTPVRPDGDGWLLWDTRSDRHSGWLRVRRPDGTIWEPPPADRRVLESESFFARGGEQYLSADSELYGEYVSQLPRITVEERDAALAQSADAVVYAVTFSAVDAPPPSHASECGCHRVVLHLDRRWRQ